MRRALRFVAVIAACTAVASACSGVPTSSSPEVIGTGPSASASLPLVTPEPNADARQIVSQFLQANVGEPGDPRGAHLFLTPAEQTKWSDSTVTILQQRPGVGLAVAVSADTTEVTVTGRQVARLAADGTYTPELAGSDGGAGQPLRYRFALRLVGDQWRIADLPDGLIITAADFANTYTPARKLYYFDSSEEHLVPDLRYSALATPQAIASWQLTQLLDGARAQLASAVRSEVPSQLPTSPRPSVTVASGPLVSVELPGSLQLDGFTKQRLAAQLMATFGQIQGQLVMTVTDGGRPIDIPRIPTRFTKADITEVTGLFESLPPPVFYIDDKGRLVDANGKPVSGPIGVGGRYFLTSVAVASRNSSSNYEVAATTGNGAAKMLWIGTLSSGLHRVAMPPGAFTRPSWAPGLREAWVGVGTRLYRVGEGGAAVSVPTGLTGGQIKALRFSSDGTRLAMIVVGPNGVSQVWVGSVIRLGETVRIDSPQPITPAGYAFTDVAWNDDTTIYMIGHDPSQNSGVWSVEVDGSSLQARPSIGLPQAPDSITAAPGGGLPAWVSAAGAVFKGTSDWEGPNRGTTLGTKPVYLE